MEASYVTKSREPGGRWWVELEVARCGRNTYIALVGPSATPKAPGRISGSRPDRCLSGREEFEIPAVA